MVMVAHEVAYGGGDKRCVEQVMCEGPRASGDMYDRKTMSERELVSGRVAENVRRQSAGECQRVFGQGRNENGEVGETRLLD